MELLDSKQKDTDDSDHATSVAHVYLRNLLFACCKPNQLNFQDLSFTFIALEAWAAQASLEDYSDEGLLVVDMVKPDGECIENVASDSKKRELMMEYIGKLQGLGKLTVVPIVGNANILSTLWQAGANYIQGHYLQVPTSDMDDDFSTEE
jgi:hypothetical protein